MPRTEEQIRRARRESGFSQEALAERIGVPPAELNGYEEGAPISSRHLQLIAVATGKPLSFFLDGTGFSSRNGRGITGRLRSALAWLSAPAGADTDVDGLLAEVAARERALAERERRLADRERRLAEREQREREVRSAAADTEFGPRAEDVPAEAASGFNLDALEHALYERAAEFPERAQEWRAYMVFLREFVHADGNLPPTFNPLVREVFRELL
jgi:transcriptional regulator with XRE-family HTH domain